MGPTVHSTVPRARQSLAPQLWRPLPRRPSPGTTGPRPHRSELSSRANLLKTGSQRAMSDEPTSLKAWHGALKCGETTDEGVPPESIGDIVTALLASMWLAGPSESDPAPPPDDGVLKCAPLRRLGIDGCEEAQTASLTATSLALDSEGGAALALQLAEIGASRAAKDEDEAHGCASLDRAFVLTMVDGTKHVLEAASVEDRREWLALLCESPARQSGLFKGNNIGISLLYLSELARGTQLGAAKRMYAGLRPQDVEVLNGPFQNGVTLEAAARLVQEKLGLGALSVLETIQKAREIVEGLAEHKATTEMSLRSEVKEDMALICEHLGLETNWVEEDKKVGDDGWEKKSELGDGSWAVRLPLAFPPAHHYGLS